MDLFQSTKNTRPILENSIRLIRSDVPTDISEDEKKRLLSNQITTIIDLRTKEERAKKKCPLIDDSRFSYICVPITGGDRVPNSTDEVSKSYIGMVDAQFDELIARILNASSNVLYFCNAGKDRTGVVSAVLLYHLGLDFQYIVEDYLKSKANLETMLMEYAKQNPHIDIAIITPQKRYIEEFLNWYRHREPMLTAEAGL